MENGETEEAIVNYQKSLDLNPGNSNAVEMLAKMGVRVSLPEKQVDPDILKSYVGTYQLFEGFDIVITLTDNHLFAQATGQLAYEIFAKSDTEFYYKVVDAQITFHSNDKGITNTLTLIQNGREVTGKKK